MTTGPEARQLGLIRALEEFEKILAADRHADEEPDDLDNLLTYIKD